MKRTFIAALALLCASPLMAGQGAIESGVIHNYRYVGAGYGYLKDVVGNASAHGGVGELSYEFNNILIGAGGSYFVVDSNPQVDLWSITGAIGYVLRMKENHINIIPRFGFGYSEASANGFSADSTTIMPGVLVSYAFNNRFSVNGGYTYGYDIDSEADAHLFSVGSQFALTECIGLNFSANFTEDNGFSGVVAGATFHF